MRGLDAFGLTDRGRQRSTNEDQFLIGELGTRMSIRHTSLSATTSREVVSDAGGCALIVADGMGGARAGERASELAIEALLSHLVNVTPWLLSPAAGDGEGFEDELQRAIRRCNEEIFKESREHPEREGMGTTLTLALVLWPRLYVAHAGDSRCYLHREGRLEQLTSDHTVARELIDKGGLEEGQAAKTPLSHILTNVLGGDETGLLPQVQKRRLRRGDLLLLATDGLTKHVSDDEILTVLDRRASAQEICETLVHGANDAGGSDNVTVVVARFTDAPKTATVSDVSEEEADPEPRRAAA